MSSNHNFLPKRLKREANRKSENFEEPTTINSAQTGHWKIRGNPEVREKRAIQEKRDVRKKAAPS